MVTSSQKCFLIDWPGKFVSGSELAPMLATATNLATQYFDYVVFVEFLQEF